MKQSTNTISQSNDELQVEPSQQSQTTNYYEDLLIINFNRDGRDVGTQQMPSTSNEYINDSTEIDFNNNNTMMEFMKPESNKRRKASDSSNTGVSSIAEQKNTCEAALKIYKSLFARDIRRAYPRLLQDAVNTTNFKHLANIMARICTKDCKYTQCHTQASNAAYTSELLFGPGVRELVNRSVLIQYTIGVCIALPDILFQIQDFKLRQMSHIPRSFDGIPIELLWSSELNILDTYMSQVAAFERVEPTRGFVLVGKYSLSGTRVLDVQLRANDDESSVAFVTADLSSLKSVLNNSFIIQSQSKRVVKPNIKYQGYFIWVLNNDNKISRLEFHADMTNALSERNSNFNVHPLEGIVTLFH